MKQIESITPFYKYKSWGFFQQDFLVEATTYFRSKKLERKRKVPSFQKNPEYDLPESCLSRSGLLAMTEVLLEGMGIEGLCLFCIA